MSDKHEGYLLLAERDVAVIEALSADLDKYSEAICFHAQQAAEKLVKNVFIDQGAIAPKIHLIDELLENAKNNKWLQLTSQEIKAATDLSVHAVMSRYDIALDISAAEAYKAIKDCNRLAKMLSEQGYDSILIDETNAKEFLTKNS